MRVLFEMSICRFIQTGLAVYAKNLAQALAQSSHNVTVIPCLIPDFPLRKRHPGFQKLAAAYWQIVHAQLVLPLQARQQGVDLVHYSMAMPVAANLPCPAVATIHDLIPFQHPEWAPPLRGSRMRQGTRLAVKRSQHILTDSEATRRDVLDQFAVSPGRVTTVLLGAGVRLPDLSADQVSTLLAARFKLVPGYVLCVSSLEPRKNLERVIEAYSLLLQKRADLPQLVIAGGASYRPEHIAAMVTKYRVDQRVIFTGHVSDTELSALFRGAGVFVYPSLYEGFGLPPLEAMHCGCPVVTSNTSSLPEVVGDAALLVDPLQPAQIAEAIGAILADGALADSLRSRGYRQVAQFSWERCASETVAIYRQVLGV